MASTKEKDPMGFALEAEDMARVRAKTALYEAIEGAARKGDHATAQGMASALNIIEPVNVEG